MWNENEKLFETAVGAYYYIDSRKVSDEKGVRWSVKDAYSGKHFCNDEISLYSGSAGVGKFLRNLYDLTGEDRYIKDAAGAADYILYRWYNERELDKNFGLYAYTTGYSGVAAYLTGIYRATGGEKYRKCVEDIVDTCVKELRGSAWSSHPGIVGNAGTLLFLLQAAKEYERDDWKRFAVDTGKYYLDQGITVTDGICYKGVDPAYFGAGNDLIDPNFPMGSAGVGFLLLRLYEASGDPAFLKAEEGVLPFLKSVSVKQRRGSLLPHALPYRPDLFYLGYCHGPAGTIRYLYEGYRVKGLPEYKEYAEELLKGLLDTGAPRRRSAGYWNVHNLCCGTAGVLHLLLSLLSTGDFLLADKDKLEELAVDAGKYLLEESAFEGGGIFWQQALDRVTPKRLSGSIGYYEGAAGIADELLSLYRYQNGGFRTERAADDPFPAQITG